MSHLVLEIAQDLVYQPSEESYWRFTQVAPDFALEHGGSAPIYFFLTCLEKAT